MPAVFGALTMERGDVDFGGELADVRLLPEQRVDLLDLGALRVASCERPADGTRIACCRRTGTTLILKGVLGVTPPPAGAPGDPGARDDPRARWLLSKILAEGREAAVGLPGHYLAILWEPRLERLTLLPDELGLYPVHYASQGGSFLFGTHTLPFERARGFRRGADPAAVIELLQLEHLLGERCMARGVSLIPPGSFLEVTRGGRVILRAVRDPFRDRAPAPRSIEEAAEAVGRAYNQAFLGAASLVTDAGRLVVPLSGGRDSRTVACELLRADPTLAARTTTFSIGDDEHWDALCAREVAASLGVPWRLRPFDDTIHDRWHDRVVSLMDGSGSAYVDWFAQVLETAADPSAAIATGFLGDALSGGRLGLFHPALDRAGPPLDVDPGIELLLARRAQRCFPRAMLARTLRREVATDWLDAPARTLRESYFAVADAPRHTRMIRTDLLHRQRRLVAAQLHIYRQRHVAIAPFADPVLLRVFLSLSEDQLRGQAAYVRALALRHPAVAGIMDARTQAPLGRRVRDRVRCGALRLLTAARDRVRSRLLGRPWVERNFFTARDAVRGELARDLDPLDRFFDPDALRAELGREEPIGAGRLRTLLTLRTWLRNERPAAQTRPPRWRRAA